MQRTDMEAMPARSHISRFCHALPQVPDVTEHGARATRVAVDGVKKANLPVPRLLVEKSELRSFNDTSWNHPRSIRSVFQLGSQP